MTIEPSSPFSDDRIDEIPLPDSPLVKTLVQLKFPQIAAIETNKGIAEFQSALNDRYPVMTSGESVELAVSTGANAAVQLNTSVVHQLCDRNDVGRWTVSLAPNFVALETATYTSREDLIDRWAEVLEATTLLAPRPRFFDRLGVRYINRLTSDEVANLDKYVNPQMVGIEALSSDLEPGQELVATVATANFRIDGTQVIARWGKVPPGGIVAPGVDAVDHVSWVLDTDVFIDSESMMFDVERICEITRSASLVAYRFFRWVATDQLLSSRGGST